jgi:phenylacetic acid degradation operon negative regulatory protein
MGKDAVIDGLLARFHARHPIRAGSLVITVYGDAVAPRGGSLWLGSLLAIMGACGIGDGVVRTAMSRLAQDGWLERTRIGRNSHYRLAAKGRAVFDGATRRIYFGAPGAWDGTWRLAVLIDAPETRARLRGRLEDLGFGVLAPNVLLRPHDARDTAPELDAGALVMEARGGVPAAARRLAAGVWPLETLADSYRRFLDQFGPLGRDQRALGRLDPLAALLVRILMIHEYRRIILRDPLLPVALLPDDWPGAAARLLCGRIYDAVRAPSERWLDGNGVNEAGPLPPPDPAFAARFHDLA